ncbi:MAG: AI-2E family transporter [Methanotrichaceae archaeon]|nr:AI-2E family transporter [Methanotrichaceae archaeon]
MKFLVVMAIEDAKKSEELSEVPAPEILEKIQKDEFEKHDRVSRRFDIAATIIVFLVFLIGVYLTQKFLSPILLSIVLVYLLKPVYDFLFRATRHGRLSSFFSIMMMFVIILYVLFGLVSVLLFEISKIERSGALTELRLTRISEEFRIWIVDKLPEQAAIYVREVGDIPATLVAWASPIAQAQLTSFATHLPDLFAQSIVIIFLTYYLLNDGKQIIASAIELIPRNRRETVSDFLQELNLIYTTLFTVYFTTSMLSGILAALGFYILGIPYPIVLGVIVAIFTLLPLLGPPFVFIPIAIYYFLTDNYVVSLILVVFGTVVLMIIPENVIRPHLAHRSARIHPIITVLAYTAPIFVVGIMGVILGPTIYGFLLAIYRIYKQEIVAK